ncbi:MAG: hypothetical protein H6626_06680 [Pseudobdellovibrionaceae bacterium]|nr:hypothetical protein [Bdellovibrionales bacterium]USN48770.1 MAG: hypothetical protein H6626_06680 [Pseudobdellovibrionaceae bacterium]
MSELRKLSRGKNILEINIDVFFALHIAAVVSLFRSLQLRSVVLAHWPHVGEPQAF